YVPQLRAQPFAGARKTRFHGADSDTQRKSDLVVAQAVDLPQHDGRLLIKRQPVERGSNLFGELLLPPQPVGAVIVRLGQFAVILDVLIQRDLLRTMTPPPPALPVARLIDDDAIDPGAKAGMAAERVDGAEHAQEDFLRKIERLVMVVQQGEGQLR